MTKQFNYAPTTRAGATYYGVIAWDRKSGGDHRRLWESPAFTNPTDAADSVNEELANGGYPDTGLKTYVTEQLPRVSRDPLQNMWQEVFG